MARGDQVGQHKVSVTVGIAQLFEDLALLTQWGQGWGSLSGKMPTKQIVVAHCLTACFSDTDKTGIKLEPFSTEVPLVCSPNGGPDSHLSAD